MPTGPYDPIAPGTTLRPRYCLRMPCAYRAHCQLVSHLTDAKRTALLECANRARREAWLRLLQDENAVPFWDVVVLTAADEAQVRNTAGAN